MLRRRQPDTFVVDNISIDDKQKRRRPLSISISLFLLILVCITIFLLTNLSLNKRTLKYAATFVYSDEDAPYKNEPVREYRKRLGKQLMQKIPDTIFVSIASYRDDACPETLADMFKKAAHPERITVGLVDQTNLDNPETDDIFCDALLTPEQRKQTRLIRMGHKAARGPTYARFLASKLWEYEQYYMQIDAHSEFAQNWDQMLIDNLRTFPDPDRYVITHYPPGEPTDLTPESPVTWICAAEDHEQAPLGLFVQSQDVCWDVNQSPDLPSGTCVSPFMGGGLFFGSADMLMDAPYDKHLDYLFHGEEVLIAARLWTRGYNLVTPRKNVLSHTYGGREKNVYGDGIDGEAARRSEARVRLLMDALVESDEDGAGIPQDEIDDLGMGTVRSIDEYKEFAGINQMGQKQFSSRCRQRFQDGQWIDVNSNGSGPEDGGESNEDNPDVVEEDNPDKGQEDNPEEPENNEEENQENLEEEPNEDTLEETQDDSDDVIEEDNNDEM